MLSSSVAPLFGPKSPIPEGILTFRIKRESVRRAARVGKPTRRQGTTVSITDEEAQRAEVLFRLQNGLIVAEEACTLLGRSRSQTYKLLDRFRRFGVVGLVSKARGRPGNRAFPSSTKERILRLIKENYHDYGPTLLAEVLFDYHRIKISAETLRQWMIKAGIWLNNRQARKRLHQPRKRMPVYGDMVQIDGSDHDWFEGRGPRCTAMVMVDDATGMIQNLEFFPRENRDAYFRSVWSYVTAHGRPMRIVTDRHSAVWSRHSETEFTKALKKLSILHSFAYSAPAKGRVERMHRTLQDRLVKAMRQKGIDTIEMANAFVPGFIRRFNRKFKKPSFLPGNHHEPVATAKLDRDLSRQYSRSVTKNLTFSWDGCEYLIARPQRGEDPIGRKVTLQVQLDGAMRAFAGNRELRVQRHRP